jgi:hypothetical protein
MIESVQAVAALIAFQLETWQRIALAPKASTHERNQARKKFLALIAKHPEIAEEYGFTADGLADSGQSTGDSRHERACREMS